MASYADSYERRTTPPDSPEDNGNFQMARAQLRAQIRAQIRQARDNLARYPEDEWRWAHEIERLEAHLGSQS